MSILKKIAEIQYELLSHKFSKSGYNSHNKFSYFELDDILPVVVEKCYSKELLMSFDFTNEKAILILQKFDKSESFSTSIPMPEIVQINRGTSLIQSLGGYNTYLKRYLILNTFMICEDELIDSTKTEKVVDETITNIVKGLIKYAKSQGRRPLKGILIKCALSCEKLTEEEKEKVISYIKELPNGEVRL